MDKLDHIFELQKGFQDKLKRERGLEGIRWKRGCKSRRWR